MIRLMRKVEVDVNDYLPIYYGLFCSSVKMCGKSHPNWVHFLQENIRCAMKLKTDAPFGLPEDIRARINGLQSTLDHATDIQ